MKTYSIENLLHKISKDDFSAIHLTDSYGRDILLLAVEEYLKKNIHISVVEKLVFLCDLKHPNLLYNLPDTLMQYLELGRDAIPLSDKAINHLLKNSCLNRINTYCETPLLIALNHSDKSFEYVPYLIHHSNIHHKALTNLSFSYATHAPSSSINEHTNPITTMIKLHVGNPHYDLEVLDWERLLQADVITSRLTMSEREHYLSIKEYVAEHANKYRVKSCLDNLLDLKIEEKKQRKI